MRGSNLKDYEKGLKGKETYDKNYKRIWKQRVDDLVEHLGCVMDKGIRKQLRSKLGAGAKKVSPNSKKTEE